MSSQRNGLPGNVFFFIHAFLHHNCTAINCQHTAEKFTILMVYDFLYHLAGRFIFHGEGYFRQVYTAHRQAPADLNGFLPATPRRGIYRYRPVFRDYCDDGISVGSAFQRFSVATIAMLIYTQLSLLNHVQFQLHQFPFNTINWIADKHAVHPVDKRRGNQASITLLFDKVLGTYDSDAKTEARIDTARQ